MTTTPETIHEIPLDQLHASPTNPRRTFLAIEELAASIKGEGRVLQPLLVRPRVVNVLRPDEHDGFEVVFGHRRHRGAELAGLATVPCMVRAMTDAEVRSAQLAENLQRSDVHAIEEAEGFQALMAHDGISADDLAKRLGKSRSYVYGRLKLLQAIPAVRESCLQGAIIPEVALLIARLRHPQLQEKALAAIRNDSRGAGSQMDDGGKQSFRYIRDLLADKFTVDLEDALFDPEDTTLVLDAGPCSACPKRAGNAPEFEDLAQPERPGWAGVHHVKRGSPDVCTDPDCYGAKKAAHLQRQADALAAEGKAVITGPKAKAALDAYGALKGDYIPLDRVRQVVKKAKNAVTVQHVQNPKTGQVLQAVRRTDLVAAGLAEKLPGVGKPAGQPQRNWETLIRQREQQAAEATKARLHLLQRVREASATRTPGLTELQLLARAMLDNAIISDDEEALEALYPERDLRHTRDNWSTLSAEDATRLVLDCLLVDCVHVAPCDDPAQSPCIALQALADLYGVPAEGPATPEPAAPAPGTSKPPAGVRYLDPATGCTWSGKGLKPRWLRVALDDGASLADFEVKDKAGAAGAGQADRDRDPNTRDMFEDTP